MKRYPGRLGAALIASTCIAVGLVSATMANASTSADHARPKLTIVTVSNTHPQLVSGGEVLVRIAAPGLGTVGVTENGTSVADRFARQSDGTLLGLVTGLRVGENQLVATASGQRAAVAVVDHPISGPVFSGAQQHPFFCETAAFGLAPATQPLCSAPTKVTYQYRNTSGAFEALAAPSDRPADLATTTVDGSTVPYVVRVETGTIDRAVYQIAALYDGHSPSPLRRDSSWNQKLIYAFGGGCNGGYHQGNITGGVLNDMFLSQGYAVASSSLNVLENNCSSIISAEAAMMVKEHFIDTYGPVAFTIGWGGSGGSIQQYDIADAYPGILDGIIPGYSFPDPFTALDAASDCRLLDNFFGTSGSDFTAAQRQAVEGFLSTDSCTSWDANYANRITATGSCNKEIASNDNTAIPSSAIWNAQTNPTGVKCAAAEQYANQFGRNPTTGMVRSLVDNVGVQYGLVALERGQITGAQFVALNSGIGGYDGYGALSTQRTEADPHALDAAYRDDILPRAGLGLADTPIIDQRVDLDQLGPLFDIHTTQWSSVMRARLQEANGTAANQVIIDSRYTPDQIAAASSYELSAMDRWLTNIENDQSAKSRQAKVIADKPADLGDGCYLSATDRILAPITDPATGACAAAYPVGSDPREQAGEPQALETLKCRLTPIDFSSYPVTFTAEQRARLRRAFPDGVCDYGLPGVGQVPAAGTWLSYGQR